MGTRISDGGGGEGCGGANILCRDLKGPAINQSINPRLTLNMIGVVKDVKSTLHCHIVIELCAIFEFSSSCRLSMPLT